MSYNNAEPKTLKTLNSSGQVLDDSGNVISDTTDYWEKVYNEAEPKPDKILHSDGTIKDSAGNLIQDTTEFNVKKYNQAEPIPAKYLHSDGTIDENPGSGSGADLEDNKTATINVSTYTEPVEITPTSGKDGMKKATVTLSNIPSGGAPAYCWRDMAGEQYFFFSFDKAPSSLSENDMSMQKSPLGGVEIVTVESLSSETYHKMDDGMFYFGAPENLTLVRFTDGDSQIFSLLRSY